MMNFIKSIWYKMFAKPQTTFFESDFDRDRKVESGNEPVLENEVNINTASAVENHNEAQVGGTVTLKRSYFSKGVHGELIFPSGESIHTLERPWKSNEVGESCIPEGVYTVGLRPSPIVERTSKGEFTEGWEVEDVPERSYIMVHIGNYVKNSDGCILTGTTKSFQGSVPVVWQSGKAFDKFMRLMDEENIVAIEITRA